MAARAHSSTFRRRPSAARSSRIKSLISHEMETGFRPNATGQLIPRNIIKEFVCTYNGVEVFRAEFFPAVSANPFVSFTTRGDRERHHHDDLDRRQRILRHRVGRHHRRIARACPGDAGTPVRRTDCAASNELVADLAHRCRARDRRRHRSAIAEIPMSERKSGYDFMARETQAMQDDDTSNAGMLWVLDGETLWNRHAGAADKSCADCHGDARASMKGVAARYPAFSPALGRPVNLEQRINICRADRQQAKPFAYESKDLLALTAFVGRQSRGMPIAVADDARTRTFVESGRAAFTRRQGQLNLSCAQCHDDNWSGRLAGNPVTQGQPTGYPIYRLEWQNLGSLQRRLRNCLTGMRAESCPRSARRNWSSSSSI